MTELSLHILDIAQNSIKAGSDTIGIFIDENVKENFLTITIKDNGCGMDEEFLRDVVNPFKTTRTMRKVGMGLSLLKSACELTGGKLSISSEVGEGTEVKAYFVYNSIDRQPVGNMASTITALISANEKINFLYRHKFCDKSFEFSTAVIKKTLGDEVPLSEIDVLKWIEDYINENLEFLYGGVV